MRKIAAMLTLLFVTLILSCMRMNTVHAVMTGTFTEEWTETGSSTLSNGTSIGYYKDTFVYSGVFSGNSTGNETDYSALSGGGRFRAVENFAGSFNASQPGALTFQDEGYYSGIGLAGHWASSFSGGTDGLAGLQGTMEAQYPEGSCSWIGNSCSVQGTYTVTSATWGTTPS